MICVSDFAAGFAASWPWIFAVDLSRYVVTAGLAAGALALLGRRLASRRIRKADPPKGQRRSEILASLRTVLVFSLVGFAILLGVRHGVLQVYPTIEERGWLYLTASLVLAIVAQDAWFYWTHRAMHHPALFRWFHRRHHRSVLPTPWTAYSFDAPEALMQAAFLPVFLLFVPMHGLAIFLFVTHMIVRNVIGHTGYELMPRALAHSRAWGWITSVTHHDLHHETPRWNYSLYFTWWDRLMDTEHPQYRQRLSRAPAALLLAIPLLAVPADPVWADPVHGDWATQGYSARVRIAPCGDGLCGTIVWLWEPADDSGRAVTDANNPDASLRDRPLLGVRLLEGFTRVAAGAWSGAIYNPEDGRTYTATMRVGAADELRLRGCVLGIFCRTQVWRRASEVCAVAVGT